MDQNRLVKDIRRCDEAIHAARTLHGEQLYEESISRSYYAVIHAVMVFLAESGEDTRSPARAEQLFTPAFVGEQGLDRELITLFETVRRAKLAASRDFLVKYSGEHARDMIGKARTFLDITRRHFSLPPERRGRQLEAPRE